LSRKCSPLREAPRRQPPPSPSWFVKRFHNYLWTLLFAAATVGFALTAHRDAWIAWRWVFLALAGAGICGGWVADEDPIGTIFGRRRGKHIGWWIATAIGLAILAAMAYRWGLGEQYVPTSLHWFAVVAMGIGATEELLWRGWMQGTWTKTFGSTVAVLAAAGSHAAYKTALFVFPPEGIARQSSGSLLFLAAVTFGFGAVLGLIRLRQGTIAAPVVFHVLFDLLVYGQCASAPWWVWQ
jgi:membrane protease YdiL (CAAX protease family)